MIEPLRYLDMVWLSHNSPAIYTDSGGLQKEAYFHRVACVTLRDGMGRDDRCRMEPALDQ
jgi:UDP-GlcNAc3NAcA epimerase